MNVQRIVHALRAAVMLLAIGLAPARAGASDIAIPRDSVDLPGDVLEQTLPPVPHEHVQVRRGRFEFSYPARMEPLVARSIEQAPRDARSIANQLGLTDLPRLRVRFVRDLDGMRALAPRAAPPPSYAVGVAYPRIGLTLVAMVSPGGREAVDVPRVLRHEISHLLLAAATEHADVPRWFSEGLAIQQAGEHDFTRFRTLAMAGFTGALLPLPRLDAAFADGSGRVDIAYAQSASFVDFMMHSGGSARFPVLVVHLREGMGFEQAVRETYARSLLNVDADWRQEVRVRFLTAPLWAGTGLLWIAAAGLLVLAAARRRQRGREIMARWEAEAEALAGLHIQIVSPGAATMAHDHESDPRLN